MENGLTYSLVVLFDKSVSLKLNRREPWLNSLKNTYHDVHLIKVDNFARNEHVGRIFRKDLTTFS